MRRIEKAIEFFKEMHPGFEVNHMQQVWDGHPDKCTITIGGTDGTSTRSMTFGSKDLDEQEPEK